MNKCFTYILCCLMISIGCNGWRIDDVVIDADREWAIPIGSGTYFPNSFFNDPSALNDFIVEADGSVAVIYQSNPIAIDPGILLPSIPFGIPIPIQDTFVEVALPSLNGLTISSALLAGDNLSFTFSSLNSFDQQVIVSSPSFVKEGHIFRDTFEMAFGGSLPTTLITDPMSLAGYRLVTQDQNIILRYQPLDQDQNFAPLLAAFFTISGISFEEFTGMVTRTEIPLPSGFVAVDFFDNYQGGEAFVSGPEITVEIDNSFGLPIGVNIDQIIVTAFDGSQLPLESNLIEEVLNIDYPSITEKGQSKKSIFTFDNTNSNIESVFSAIPVQVNYAFSGFINPDNSDEEFCINQANVLSGIGKVKIPLAGYAESATLIDTFLFDVDSIGLVEEAEISWIAENNMPAGIKVQFTMIDQRGNSLGNLFEDQLQLVGPAVVDEAGNLVEPAKVVTKIPIPGTIIDNLNQTVRLAIIATFDSFNPTQRVVFKSDQALLVQIGLKFKQAS